MRRLALRLREWFGFRTARPKAASRPKRPGLEVLEDRAVPANASGVVEGVTFVDVNHDHVRQATEGLVGGALVRLTGKTDQGTAVNVKLHSDPKGHYVFLNVQPGAYHLDGGRLFRVNGGQTVHRDVPGVPQPLSLRNFLASSPPTTSSSGDAKASFRPNNKPIVVHPLGTLQIPLHTANTVLDLAGVFSDPDFSNSKVRFETSAGNLDVTLFDKLAPRTVANFFNYALTHRYDNTIFHRHSDPTQPGTSGLEVLQGGGFAFKTSPSRLEHIAVDPTVQNEFHKANTPFTLAMAKLSGDPNSASSEFFFNVTDNTQILDSRNNGGFTVFGQIADAASVNTFQQLLQLPRRNEGGAFNTIPLNNYFGTNFPTDTTAANYALIKDVKVLKRDESLRYVVVSNSNPGLVKATIRSNRLTLHYNDPTKSGSAHIVLKAIDRFGATVTTAFNVSVANRAPTASVALNTSSPKTNDTLTATVTRSDPDGDPVSLHYTWKVDGQIKKQTDTSNLTDTFELSDPNNTIHGADKGQVVTVEVTPKDATLTGATATASATVADSPPTVNVTLSSTSPGTNDTLTANTTTPADADGDSVTLSFVWKRNNVVIPGATGNTLDLSVAGHGDKGDKITVEVTPSDGTLSGTPATAPPAAVVNSAPVVDTAVISPSNPAANSLLSVTVTSHDPDGDAVTNAFQWLRGGSPISGATNATLDLSTLSGVTAGEQFAVVVTPSDQSTSGAPLTSDPVTVG